MKVIQTNINKAHYNILSADSLHVGEVLVFNVFIKRESHFVIIIEAGTLLTQTLYDKLLKQDKLYITLADNRKKDLDSHSLYTHINYSKQNLKQSLEYLYTVNNKTFSDFFETESNIIDMDAIIEVVKSVILLTQSHKHFLKEMINHFIDSIEVPEHCLHVSIYSINLGHSLDFTHHELLQLGTAALLHDIGYKKINDDIRRKNSKLSVSELEEIHMHSKYGLEIAKRNDIDDPLILDAIMYHHEYQDGTGYPDNLDLNDISKFASIICISDIFDALTNKRSYREKYSTFDALSMMMKNEDMKYKFNQKYVQVFLKSFL